MDAAEVLAGRTTELDIPEGSVVTDAVVLCRVAQADGLTTLVIGVTESTGGLDQFGLVAAAFAILSEDWRKAEDD